MSTTNAELMLPDAAGTDILALREALLILTMLSAGNVMGEADSNAVLLTA